MSQTSKICILKVIHQNGEVEVFEARSEEKYQPNVEVRDNGIIYVHFVDTNDKLHKLVGMFAVHIEVAGPFPEME